MNKKNYLYILVFIAITVVFGTLGLYSNKAKTSLVDINLNDSNSIKLENIVEKMYVTIIDSNSNIVSTNNPETIITNSYRYTDGETIPNGKIKPTDDYYINLYLSKINDYDLENGIEENKNYYLELPSNVIPSEELIIGVEGGQEEPSEFLTNNDVKVYGGIYKIDNKYYFMFNAKQINNQIDIKMSYQFSCKILNDGTESNYKYMNFGPSGGTVNYYYDTEAPTQLEYDDLSASLSWKSSSEGLSYLDINVKHDEEDFVWSEPIEIEYKDNFFMIGGPTSFAPTITIDGETKTMLFGMHNQNVFFHTQIGNTGQYIIIRMAELKGDMKNNGVRSSNKLKIYFFKTFGESTASTFEGEPITGKHNISFQITNDRYNLNPIDKYDVEISYGDEKITRSLKHISSNATPRCGGLNYTWNNNGYNELINISCNPANSNYLLYKYEYPSDSFYKNKNYLKHYLQTDPNNSVSIFGSGKPFSIQINGKNVDFDFTGDSLYQITAGRYSNLSYADYYMINKTVPDINEYEYSYLYVSKTLNPDGKPYIIAVPKKSRDLKNPNETKPLFLFGKYETLNYPPSSHLMYTPETLDFYIFNASNENIVIDGNSIALQVFYEENNDNNISNAISFTATNNAGSTYRSNSYSYKYENLIGKNPYTLSGSMLENGIIKWDGLFNKNNLNDTYKYSVNNYNVFTYELSTNLNKSSKTLCYNQKFLYPCEVDSNDDSLIIKEGSITIMDNGVRHSYYGSRYTNSPHDFKYNVKSYIESPAKLSENPHDYILISDLSDVAIGKEPKEYNADGLVSFYSNYHPLQGNTNNYLYFYKLSTFYNEGYAIIPGIKSSVSPFSNNNFKVYIESKNYIDTKTFNGDWIIKDNIMTTNLYDNKNNVIASNIDISEYVKLREMVIVLDNENYYLSNLRKDSDGVYELGNGKLFGLNKKIYLETNAAIGENTGITDGIDVKIHNVEGNHVINLTIVLDLDYASLFNDLSETYRNLNSIGVINKVKYNSLNGEIVSDEEKIKINAALSIVKDSKKNTTTEKSLDTRENSETINVGHVDTEVLYVTDFVSYYRNYNPTIPKFNNQYDSNTFIKEFANNYLEISELEIIVDPPDSSGKKTVYKDGTFIDEYSSSAIVFNDSSWNNGELFKLELRKNNEKIKGGTEVIIKYNTVLKIDAFRSSDYYDGHLGYIVTNSQAAIPINGVSTNEKDYIKSLDTGYELENNEGFDIRNYQDYKDVDNNVMVCYASTGAGGTYLQYPEIYKSYGTSNEGSNWQIELSTGSAGKSNMFEVDLIDILAADILDNYSETSTITNEEKEKVFTYLKNLIMKYVTYSDINISYNNTDTPIISINGDITESLSRTYSNGTMSFTINNLTGYLDLGIPYEYQYKNVVLNYEDSIPYDSTLKITYKTRVDWDSFTEEAFSHKILHDNKELYKGDNQLIASLRNRLSSHDNFYNLESVAGSGNIMVYNYSTNINKMLKSSDINGTSTWELSIDSKNGNDIVINDEFGITNELLNQESLLKDNYSYDNFAIKYGDTYAFRNNTYENGFTSENIKINTSDKNKLSITLHNTNNKEFLGKGELVTIVYDLKFDINNFVSSGGSINDKYKIINSSNLINGNTTSNSNGNVNINLGIPNPLSKTREEKDSGYEDLYTINYANTNIILNNLEIKDVLNIEEQYLKYFNYNDIVIKKYNENNEDTIIYDKNTSLPNGYSLLNINNETFDIKNDKGFILKIDTLGKNEKIIITYNLKIDYDSYFADGNVGNTTILIKNISEAFNSIFAESYKDETEHNFKIKEHFYKSVYSSDNNKVTWSIDLNLLTKYDSEYLRDKKLVITDKLEKSLSCPTNVSGYYFPNNTSNRTDFTPLFECADNVLKITIDDLTTYNSIQVYFSTPATGSIPDVKNSATYALISQDNEVLDETYTEEGEVKNLLSAKISALLTSRGVATYTINAYKYLDNKLTEKKFNFYAYECDSEGNKIDGGYESIVQNDEEGKITFDAINFKNVGTYYYKIGEVLQESQKYALDDSNYILKVEVDYYDNKYVVKSTSIEGFDEEETINFYNYTLDVEAPEEEFKEVPKTDIPIYPNNNPRLKNNNKLLLVYLIVVSGIMMLVIYIKNKKVYNNNL